MNSWNQWGTQAGAAPFSQQDLPAGQDTATTQNQPQGTYPVAFPYYGAAQAMGTVPDLGGYGQQWNYMHPQWQTWQQWQTQYNQWQQQYADKLPEGAIPPVVTPQSLLAVPPLPPPDRSVPPPPPEETESQEMTREPVKPVDPAQFTVPPPSLKDDFRRPPPGHFSAGYSVGGSLEGPQGVKRHLEEPFKGPQQFPTPDVMKKPRIDSYRSDTWGRHPGDKVSIKPVDDPKAKPVEGDYPLRHGIKENPDDLSEGEKAFDIQFEQWQQQFMEWKEQNKNHPDKEQYRQYEAKWESWRGQLLQRREQMRKKRESSNRAAMESVNESFQQEVPGSGAASRWSWGSSWENQQRAGRRPAEQGIPESECGPGGRRINMGPVPGSDLPDRPVFERDQRSEIGPMYKMSGPPQDHRSHSGPVPELRPDLPQVDNKGYNTSHHSDSSTMIGGGNVNKVQSFQDHPEAGMPPNFEHDKQDANIPEGGELNKAKEQQGIPGLDLLSENDKLRKESDANAEDMNLSVGHDIDDRVEKASTFIGPVPQQKEGWAGMKPDSSSPDVHQRKPGSSELNADGSRTAEHSSAEEIHGPRNVHSFDDTSGSNNFRNYGPQQQRPFQRHTPDMQGPVNVKGYQTENQYRRGGPGPNPDWSRPDGPLNDRRGGPGQNADWPRPDGPLNDFRGGPGPNADWPRPDSPPNEHRGGPGPSSDWPRPDGPPNDRRGGPGPNTDWPRPDGPPNDRRGGLGPNADWPRPDGPPNERRGGPVPIADWPRPDGPLNERRGGPGQNSDWPRPDGPPNDRRGGPGPNADWPRPDGPPSDRRGGLGPNVDWPRPDGPPNDRSGGPGQNTDWPRPDGPANDHRFPPPKFSPLPAADQRGEWGARHDGDEHNGTSPDLSNAPRGDNLLGQRGGSHAFDRGFPGQRDSYFREDEGFYGRDCGKDDAGNYRTSPGPMGPSVEVFNYGPSERNISTMGRMQDPGQYNMDYGQRPQGARGRGRGRAGYMDNPPAWQDRSRMGGRGRASTEGYFGFEMNAPPQGPGTYGSARQPPFRRSGSEYPPGPWGEDRDRRFTDFPKEWDPEVRDYSTWEGGRGWEPERERERERDPNFDLEPATVVDYAHKPVTQGGTTNCPPSVQTFDYGHGSGRQDNKPPSDRWKWEKGRNDWDKGRDDWDKGRDDWGKGRDDWGKGRDDWDKGRSDWDKGRSDWDKGRNEWDKGRSDWDKGRGDWDKPRGDKPFRERAWNNSSRDMEKGDFGKRDQYWKEPTSGRPEADSVKPEKANVQKESDAESRSNLKLLAPPPPPPPPKLSTAEVKTPAVTRVLVQDLLFPPNRATRPKKIAIFLRGLPGSGKTFVAKLIKDKEFEMGGPVARILGLDDYFMVDADEEKKDPETGRKIITKKMEYEYDASMEDHYRNSLVKAFCKNANDGYFPFIIVDAINDKVKHFEEMYNHAKQKGFQVYICEMDAELSVCAKRNIHSRTEKEIADILKNWEETPRQYTQLDVRSLLQSAAITEVEMEDTVEKTEGESEEINQVEEEEKSGEKAEEEPDKTCEVK